MKPKKNIIFKISAVVSIALFLVQCTTIRRGNLLLVDEKIEPQPISSFLYRIEKIKEPTAEDPAVEYKLVKFPMQYYWKIESYEKVKVKHGKKNLLCVLGGMTTGALLGHGNMHRSEFFSRPAFVTMCAGLGALVGVLAAPFFKGKSALVPGETIETREKIDEPDLKQPIPLPHYPIDLTFSSGGRIKTVRMESDENGIIRVHPERDLCIPGDSLHKPVKFVLSYVSPDRMNTLSDEYVFPR